MSRSHKTRPVCGPRPLHVESLEARQLLAGDMGDALIFAGGTAQGTKWHDTNGNGQRDEGERGLAGVVIYADVNHNAKLDKGEPWTRTQRDNPDTRHDETGQYVLPFLPVGKYQIREVVPEGFRQTFPGQPVTEPAGDPLATVNPRQINAELAPGEELDQAVSITIHPLCIRPYEFEVMAVKGDAHEVPGVHVINHTGIQVNGCGGDTSEFKISMHTEDEGEQKFDLAFVDMVGGDVLGRIPVTLNGHPAPGGHPVAVEVGSEFKGLDFGNAKNVEPTGSIEGRKWLDQNGNGQRDAGEPGLGGVEVYLDLNNNGKPDRHEPRTRTEFENHVTDFEEAGRYSFPRVAPGSYAVREVVPRGYTQTFPAPEAAVLSSETGRFGGGSALDWDLTDVGYKLGEEGSKTELELTMVWPNGCGSFLADATTHAVIGNTILVNAYAQATGTICTDVVLSHETTVGIPNLKPGSYTVSATLHERAEDGERATLGAVGEIRLGSSGAHRVQVEAGQTVSNVNFGNRRDFAGESLEGVKWNDKNGNGRRDRDEPGLGGVTIYLDLDGNGRFNEGEPVTRTAGNATPGEAPLGHYRFNVEPGNYIIREVVPDGFRQTFPPLFPFPFPEPRPVGPDGEEPIVEDPIFFERPGAHHVQLLPGQHLEGLDFGNQANDPGSVHGTKWADENGNGRREDNEPGLAGVTIYSDLNNNGQLDEDEPHTVSMRNDPNTEADETGHYWLKLRPGRHTIREVVPDGFAQTFPRFGIPLPNPLPDPLPQPPLGADGVAPNPDLFRPIFLGPGAHFVNVSPGQTIEGKDFGNQKLKPGSVHGLKWRDDNGNGQREPHEPGLPGVVIYSDLNGNGKLDEGEPRTVTKTDDANTPRDETGHYWLEGLRPNQFHQIREVVPEGFRQTFPPVHVRPPIVVVPPDRPAMEGEDGVGDRLIFPNGQHSIYVRSGQAVERINFGNQPSREPGQVAGVVWQDLNGNGQRQPTEPGMGGVTVFSDSNLNGKLDAGEPKTVSSRDNPKTPENEAGQYQLKLTPGHHLILQQVPEGHKQTHPNVNRKIASPFNLGHSVTVESGKTQKGVDFGNHRDRERPGVLSGVVWMDDNGNGVQDRGEGPHSGVTVYLDNNNNGRRDRGEPSTKAGRANAAGEDFRIQPNPGYYRFDVKPGEYTVRQETPKHYAQTYPYGSFAFDGNSFPVDLPGGVAQGFDLVDVSVGTTSSTDNGESPVVLTFETKWPNGKMRVRRHEVSVHDQQIQVTLIAVPVENGSETPLVEQTRVSVGPLPFGGYGVRGVLVEQRPNVEPVGDVESFLVEAKFNFRGDDAHRVSIGPGEALGGLNFGTIATPVQPGPDSQMGEDPHPGERNEKATRVVFEKGHLRVNSYVDRDDDLDVFRFEGHGGALEGEGGRADGSEHIRFEILTAAGEVIAKAAAGSPLEAETVAGETYFLQVSGAQGEYMIDIFASDAAEDPNEQNAGARRGDINGNGEVDFQDFLKLAANFNQRVDAAFAEGDLDGDLEVTFKDFLILAANFGKPV